MLSIIICSRNKVLSKEFVDNIDNSVGIDYEIIAIDNSKNSYSINSAYNTGFAKSIYPYVCFVHEDVQFHTKNWGEKVIHHLQRPDSGIIGLAGSDLVTRIPGSCAGKTSSANIIQSDKSGRKPSVKSHYPINYDQSKRSTILLDGVFLCMRRDLMEKLNFDEQLDGFHGYDFDISLQSAMAGHFNYVIYDIELEHFSKGQFKRQFYSNLISVFKKWQNVLPLFGPSVTIEKRSQIYKIEEKRLFKLIKKMILYGFSTKEIITETTYFEKIINSSNVSKKLRITRLRIILIRLFNCPQYLLK